MEHVRWTAEPPTLRSPTLLVAFTGWNDAGEAASQAVKTIAESWQAQPIADIDPEEFFDFQSTRPHVRLVEGGIREIDWPSNELSWASTPGGDVLLLSGTEPQLKWRTFTGAIAALAERLNVRLAIALGALLADVAHNRPVPIIGTGTDQRLIDRFSLQRSKYEGPTGIVGVLHDTFANAGIPSASLWAAVPAYLPGAASPKAALALVERCASIIGSPVDVSDLATSAYEYEREVDAVVANDDELQAYMARLDAYTDDDDDDDEVPETEAEEHGHETLTAEELVREVERYLRDQGSS
jgi:proteasome assembly chaperone (PAC2) family protein